MTFSDERFVGLKMKKWHRRSEEEQVDDLLFFEFLFYMMCYEFEIEVSATTDDEYYDTSPYIVAKIKENPCRCIAIEDCYP
jgi:hypothetical protein